MFRHDATGYIEEARDSKFLKPKGWYEFIIESVKEKKTANGNDSVSCKCVYADDSNQWVYHNVTFLPVKTPLGEPVKGAGMSIHFRKCIGEPHEGAVDVDPNAWIAKRFMGYVVIGEWQGKKRNEIKKVASLEEMKPKNESEVPF